VSRARGSASAAEAARLLAARGRSAEAARAASDAWHDAECARKLRAWRRGSHALPGGGRLAWARRHGARRGTGRGCVARGVGHAGRSGARLRSGAAAREAGRVR
jgi:hypothetical protein